MVKGEFIEEDNSVNFIKEQKIKEQLLDEAFKKAEIKRGVRQPDYKKSKKTTYEKNFPKLFILLILAAMILWICINYVPWGYIKYDTGSSKMELSINRDFILYNGSEKTTDTNVSNDITNLFSKSYYLGLSTDDFSSASQLAENSVIALIILGILITIFWAIDKLFNFSAEIFITIHFVIAAIVIVPCMFIVLSAAKFIGAQILLYYNIHFITAKILTVTFPAAFALITLGFIVIRIMFTVIGMDFKEMQKLLKTNVTDTITPRYGE
ncbi:MAG: hypothetical protein QHH19_03225 [Candidatus Thermoplasmatota archaeon]|jgi:hypothetical protein|nr:hypothetical protein [Candidatus Thermoplasmatota archaeon]